MRRTESDRARYPVWTILISVAVLAISCVGLFVYGAVGSSESFGRLFGTSDGCRGCREAASGAEIRRGSKVVTRIVQIAAPAASTRPLPLYLVASEGAVIDSARAGYLVGRLDSQSTYDVPIVSLVPRDSTVGRPLAYLIAGGSAAIPVFAPHRR